MIYSYLGVSSEKQSVENQRFEILKYASDKKITIDYWVDETESGAIKVKERLLGQIILKMKKGGWLDYIRALTTWQKPS